MAAVFCPSSSSFSLDISSSDIPFGSGTRKVKKNPRTQQAANANSEFLIPIPAGYPLSLFAGSLSCAAYKNPNAPTIAPAFPAAADIPWHVDLNLAGKISAGTMKVVLFGPKLAKKKVKAYITTKPM
ncbi:hypothetical protein M5K25_017171 [Dendrobium thyrsiflorum]|uniref:Uncharacterized protein n=1 Tax=Dendrobium thyrsiflorum TaxID=117978 RepID=A0ABD0UTY8_DENTH